MMKTADEIISKSKKYITSLLYAIYCSLIITLSMYAIKLLKLMLQNQT